MIYDVDGNGIIHTFSDGLILLKYIIGHRGTALINGGIGAGATRATAPQIEGYIETIYWTLDVGGDGKVGYGDGLMILKYMASFRGPNLTNGAVSAGSIRSTAKDIEDYLRKMTTDVVAP